MMGSGEKKLRRLDFGKLNFAEKCLSTKETLENVTPMEWPKEVCSGAKKVVVLAADQKEKR